MEYRIVLLYQTPRQEHRELVLAKVPFEWYSEMTCFKRAYDIAEFLAKGMFGERMEIRELKGQLYPMYFADNKDGRTIQLK